MVACSGGADSVCLLRLLHAVAREAFPMRLAVAHVNYRLRADEADGDALFCRDLAESLGLSFHLRELADEETLFLREGNLQEKARELRQVFLEELRLDLDLEGIALGHHRDDLVETMLLRLIRGTGPSRLPGMTRLGPGPVLRPMLDLTRAEILEVLEVLHQGHREDRSNDDPRYLRNRIRHELVPCLESIEASSGRQLLRFAELLHDEDEALSGWCERLWEEHGRLEATCPRFPRAIFVSQPVALQRRLLRLGVHLLGRRAPNRERIEAARALVLSAGPGRRVQMGGGVELHRLRDALVWTLVPPGRAME